MPTTPHSGITHIEKLQGLKEVTANEAFDALDNLINGGTAITVTGNFTLTEAQFRDNVRITFDGAPAATFTVQTPAATGARLCGFVNNTNQAAIIENGTSTAVNPITVWNGDSAIAQFTGGDWELLAYRPGILQNIAGKAGMALKVKDAENGFEWGAASGGGVGVVQRPRFRGALAGLTSNLTALDFTAGPNIGFTKEVIDTDGFWEGVTNPDRITIPAGLGIRKVRLTANVRVESLTADLQVVLNIQKNGAAFDGMGRTRQQTGGATAELNAKTAAVDVVDGDYFNCLLQVLTDTSVDLAAQHTSFSLEVVEFEGAVDAPLAYLATPPKVQGAQIGLTSDITRNWIADGSVPWQETIFDTGFQPNDTGGPQRFWLGPDFTFIDADVTPGTDTIAETAHGLATGEGPFRLLSSGVLPAGLALGTDYWAIRVDADNFKVATNRANALAGTAVDITAAAGGGTHTVDKGDWLVTPEGVAKVAVTFNFEMANITSSSWTHATIVGSPTSVTKQGGQLITEAGVSTPRGLAHIDMAEVTVGQRFRVNFNNETDTSVSLTAAGSSFSIRVLETSLPLSFPGITTYPKFKGAAASLSVDLTAQNFTTETAIPWNAEVSDTDAFHDNVTNNTRITIPSSLGITKVRLGYSIAFDLHTADEWIAARIRKGGAGTMIDGAPSQADGGDTSPRLSGKTGVIDVADLEYFELMVQTELDASISVLAAESTFTIEVVETVEATLPPHDFDIFLEGVPAASNLAWGAIMARRVSFNDNFAGSQAYALTAPSGGAVVLDVDVNGTKIGDVTFADGVNAGTFNTIAAVQEDVEIGERLSIDTPANLFTAADIMITLKGSRT